MSKQSKTSMAAFGIMGQSEEGVKLNLTLPDGTETEHWLKVRGADSKAYRTEEARQKRLIVEKLNSKKNKVTPEEELKHMENARLSLLSSTVCGWSFEEECTTENVKSFLKTAPQIMDQIDGFAADRGNFMRNASSN